MKTTDIQRTEHSRARLKKIASFRRKFTATHLLLCAFAFAMAFGAIMKAISE